MSISAKDVKALRDRIEAAGLVTPDERRRLPGDDAARRGVGGDGEGDAQAAFGRGTPRRLRGHDEVKVGALSCPQ